MTPNEGALKMLKIMIHHIENNNFIVEQWDIFNESKERQEDGYIVNELTGKSTVTINYHLNK